MEIGLSRQQILLKEGVAWLKVRQKLLVEKIAEAMAADKNLPEHRLPSFLRKLVAKDMLQDLIKRLEENSFDAESAQKKMVSALKKGATVQSIVSSIDLMVSIISGDAQQQFISSSSATYDVLLNKTQYFATLLKSTAATAAIEQEKSKINDFDTSRRK